MARAVGPCLHLFKCLTRAADLPSLQLTFPVFYTLQCFVWKSKYFGHLPKKKSLEGTKMEQRGRIIFPRIYCHLTGLTT